MSTNSFCNSLDKLSAEGNWDDVFFCLQIDANSTIELASLRGSQNNENDDTWLDDYRATANSLEVILAIILLFDQIFYVALLWYLLMFACKLLRHRGLEFSRNVFRKLGSSFGYVRSKSKWPNKSKQPLQATVSAFGLRKAGSAFRKQLQMRSTKK